MTTTMTTLTIQEADSLFKTDDQDKARRQELQKYMNQISFNTNKFFEITTVIREDLSECAEGKEFGLIRIPDEMFKLYTDEIIHYILTKNMKVNGKKGQWSCGCFGSRWFDWESKDKKTTCRIAFYSKKFSKKWDEKTDYVINLRFEMSQ